ncbi:MAG: hypothetical protein P4L61_04085, partial [Candidatus Pacebacteria bacterium]|nr:hypothetical protein [Candidatus Paceibacterota bacterium]
VKAAVLFDDPMNGTYEIDGHAVVFNNGGSEQDIAPGSASKQETSIFGAVTYADLNGDGHKDGIFFVTQSSGGSGTFYYIAAAIDVGGKYIGTNAILLGDRISPQSIDVSGGIASINYAVRKEDEPMSAAPSIGVTKHVHLKNNSLVEG